MECYCQARTNLAFPYPEFWQTLPDTLFHASSKTRSSCSLSFSLSRTKSWPFKPILAQRNHGVHYLGIVSWPGTGKCLRTMRPIEVLVWSSKGWTTLTARPSMTAPTLQTRFSRCECSYCSNSPTRHPQLSQVRSWAVGRPVQLMASACNFNPMGFFPATLFR